MELVLGVDLPGVLVVVSRVLGLHDVACLAAAGACGALLVVDVSLVALYLCP